jgi:hypothetical protein
MNDQGVVIIIVLAPFVAAIVLGGIVATLGEWLDREDNE